MGVSTTFCTFTLLFYVYRCYRQRTCCRFNNQAIITPWNLICSFCEMFMLEKKRQEQFHIFHILSELNTFKKAWGLLRCTTVPKTSTKWCHRSALAGWIANMLMIFQTHFLLAAFTQTRLEKEAHFASQFFFPSIWIWNLFVFVTVFFPFPLCGASSASSQQVLVRVFALSLHFFSLFLDAGQHRQGGAFKRLIGLQ